MSKNIFSLIRMNNIAAIKELIKEGIDLESKDEYQETPLLYISNRNTNNLELINLLIDNKADVNAKDISGFTSLMIAIHKGNILLVELLINGTDLTYEKERVIKDLTRNVKKYPKNAARWNKILNILNGTMYGKKRN